MHRLALRTNMRGRESRECVAFVPCQDTPNFTALRIDDVHAVNRHRIAIFVVFKCGRRRAPPAEILIEKEMPRRDAA